MGALLSALLGFLSSILARVFTVEVAKFLAYKVLFSFLLFTGLLVVYQLVLDLTLSWIADLLSDYTSSQSVVLHVAGLGGWILSCLRVDDCISLLLSAMSIRLLLRVLPLSPVK
jgi:hypothetical protein